MIKIENISIIGDKCSGCGVCSCSCPHLAIKMLPNKEGFLYPNVDANVCTQCGLCFKLCPANNSIIPSNYSQKAYAGVFLKSIELQKSASGGIGYALSKAIIERGGVVYGCVYSSNLHVEHSRIDNFYDLVKTQSSKYVQSEIFKVLPLIKKDLNEGRLVLFVGTPCQVDAVRLFVGDNHKNLFLIDIVCHGVPSPLLFEKYIKYLNKKENGIVQAYNFRTKDKVNWGSYYYSYSILRNGKVYHRKNLLDTDKYGFSFLSSNNYRECCYLCKYSSLKRLSDITIGDFWGIDKIAIQIDSKKGVSCVITNSSRGEGLLLSLSDVFLEQVDIATISQNQINLNHPSHRPAQRDTFYDGLTDNNTSFFEKLNQPHGFKYLIKKYSPLWLKRLIKK